MKRPDYGVDGYPYIIGLLGGGALLIALALASFGVGGQVLRPLGFVALALGGLGGIPGLLGLRYVLVGKLRHRERLLDLVSWRGDETVLDVGTGGGLMLIGAAKRAPRGRAVGIDVWDARDISDNTRQRIEKNVSIEGVGSLVEIVDADARAQPFPDATFDVVFSVLCLHNIEERQDAALREIARVLKPSGVAIIADLADTGRYVQALTGLHLEVSRGALLLDTFPFQRVVVARKHGQPS